MDLAAGGRLEHGVDAVAIADGIVSSYRSLWAELTAQESFSAAETWRITERVERLNALGFDIDEMSMSTTADGTVVEIQPKVVDAGHHQRRLIRLTGLDVEENQARRLLNDLDTFRVEEDLKKEPEELVAHRWVAERFEPVTGMVPADLRTKLEPAQMYHEVLEHRWFMGERLGTDVTIWQAAADYVTNVLAEKPDEQAVLGQRLGRPSDVSGVRFDETAELDLSELDL